MALHRPLGHQELLTLARKTVAAAQDGDRDRLEAAALHLLDALLDHVDAERLELVRLPPAESRLLARGQDRLVGLLADLAFQVSAGGPCECELHAQQLLAHLSLQADDERLQLTDAGELGGERGGRARARAAAAQHRHDTGLALPS
jgi:hypothetical protein